MRLIDVLEARHQAALKTAAYRDCEALITFLDKQATDKTAGPASEFLSSAGGKVRSLFGKSFGAEVDLGARTQLTRVLQSLTEELAANDRPMLKMKVHDALSSVGKLNVQGPGEIAPGAKSRIFEITDQIGKVKSSLAKTETKLPFAAVAGLLGLQGAVGMGIGMLDRKIVDSAHKENLDLISGDTQIPANLKAKAKEMYGVLVTYAPTLAKDKTFSRDFTKNLIRHDTVDHKIVSDLITAEKAYKESKGRKAEFLQAIGDLTLKHSGWM